MVKAVKLDYQDCVWCGRNMVLTEDHIISRVFGGISTKNNIRPLCGGCHQTKNDFETHIKNKVLYGYMTRDEGIEQIKNFIPSVEMLQKIRIDNKYKVLNPIRVIGIRFKKIVVFPRIRLKLWISINIGFVRYRKNDFKKFHQDKKWISIYNDNRIYNAKR